MNQIDSHDDSSSEGHIPEEVHGFTEVDQPQAAPTDEFQFSDDDGSGELRAYTGVFEGPEVSFSRFAGMTSLLLWNGLTRYSLQKTLEVCFRKRHGEEHMNDDDSPGGRVGLRRLTEEELGRICARARCTILSSVSNQYLDAYVLSESSLFIYPYMLVLKTCGTTTLLRCIALLVDFGRKLGLEIDWVGYSRKNFNFPGDQAFPHQSFQQELDYLYSHRNL